MTDRQANLIPVTIRIHKSHADRFDAIVHSLERAGLQAVARHRRFLIISGDACEDAIDKFTEVDGVASVRRDRRYRPST